MKLYDSLSRQQTLEVLRHKLAADPRVVGILLVGSGALGFRDAFSDIDLAVVIDETEDVLTVFAEWGTTLPAALPVLWSFTDIRGVNVGLYGLILEDFLEIDISFQPLSALTARGPHWQILLDRTGRLEQVLQASLATSTSPDFEAHYARRLNSIWHYITHTAVFIRRGQLWRAYHYLEEIRNRTIELEGLRHRRQTRHFREVDELPTERLAALAQTLPASLTPDNLIPALQAATGCFFEAAAHLDKLSGHTRSAPLREAMQAYLSLVFSEKSDA